MPGVEQELHARINEERKDAIPEPHLIQQYRTYAAGAQRLTLSQEQREILKGLLDNTANTFCDNVVRRVISTVAARVRVDRQEVSDPDVEGFIKDVVVKNHLKQLSHRVHFSGIRDGDNYVTLDWDGTGEDGRVVLNRELLWNGKRGVFMSFDERGEPDYAVKEWEALVPDPSKPGAMIKATRRVVWFPEKIGRFVLRGDGWQWFPLPAKTDPTTGEVIREAEAEDWVPWVDEDGRPLGIPCVQFSRMEQPVDKYEEQNGAGDHHGHSIAAGGLLGIQDAISDDHWTLLAANRMTGYQVVTATGVALLDAQGNEVKIKAVPGAVLHVEDKDAEFGTIPAGSMAELINTLRAHHEAASRSTNTPLHVITGDWPSGEALIQADRPLVDQATALQDNFGPAWSSVMHKAVRLANHFGKRGLNEEVLITTAFYPAERSDLLTLTAIANAIAPYVSRREVLRRLGYSKEQQDQILAEIKEEAQSLNPFLVPPGVDPSDGGAEADPEDVDEDA